MLTNLVEVEERVFETATDGCHATECGSLELFTLKEGLGIFEETNVVAGDGFDQVFGGGELTECDPEVIGIVEGV